MYVILVLLAVISRIVPHAANIAPIAALALFVGATGMTFANPKQRVVAYALPIVAMLISDALIGFYAWQVVLSVYLGFAITVALGFWIRRSYHWSTVVAAGLTGSVIFFLLTNAAVWAFTPMYAKTAVGLMESYIAALPFFRNSLIGDLLYTGALFGVYELAVRYNMAPRINQMKQAFVK